MVVMFTRAHFQNQMVDTLLAWLRVYLHQEACAMKTLSLYVDRACCHVYASYQMRAKEWGHQHGVDRVSFSFHVSELC